MGCLHLHTEHCDSASLFELVMLVNGPNRFRLIFWQFPNLFIYHFITKKHLGVMVIIMFYGDTPFTYCYTLLGGVLLTPLDSH